MTRKQAGQALESGGYADSVVPLPREAFLAERWLLSLFLFAGPRFIPTAVSRLNGTPVGKAIAGQLRLSGFARDFASGAPGCSGSLATGNSPGQQPCVWRKVWLKWLKLE